ncbi:class II aldolase/adducin family protein [Spiractinospora alimapuensis]|uniref:class II aldolase/adducin family protein n=1 Tax=Spiractinospora alimapuensis TaxID=2820884 RepID=UPI001F3DEA6F|nr:class II aldolase/adducin family protein [Spiractinospora alimapuensis]QVQ54791.1 class II aldolase/adducin family protein [Spiractinospora alimapuensis]
MQREREQLADAGRELVDHGLVVGTSGNLSARSGDLVAVTPTGADLGELTPDMMSVIDLDGALVDGELAPTSEVPMHLAVYRATDTAAIAHAHALASTAVACTTDELPMIHYAMLGLGGTVRVAPYATYGSDELAANVLAALEDRKAALMQNHGSIALGSSVADSVANLRILEWLSDLYARTRSLGTPRVLSVEEQSAVVEKVRATDYGRPRPA